MVKITLTNQNKRSKYKKAIIDLIANTCLLDNETTLDRGRFKRLAFEHPLLDEPPLPRVNGHYPYVYSDLYGLLSTPKRVYATLLQADEPSQCEFIVSPTDALFTYNPPYRIPISLCHHKAAIDHLSISQLNHLISQCSGFTFQFQDRLFIKDTILFHHLPKTVNGDDLYDQSQELYALIQHQDDFTQCELRYVHPLVGLGVYARALIKKKAIVCVYYGVKQQTSDSSKYCFCPKVDALEMGVDAKYYGSLARFVNHADDPGKTVGPYLNSNVDALRYVLEGNEFIVYVARRDIQIGEQILVDYGSKYFNHVTPYRFTREGTLIDENNKVIPQKKPERNFLSVLAVYGNKEAIWLLLKRPVAVLVIAILVSVLMGR